MTSVIFYSKVLILWIDLINFAKFFIVVKIFLAQLLCKDVITFMAPRFR